MSTYKCPKCGAHEDIHLPVVIESTATTDQAGEPQIEDVDLDSFFDVLLGAVADCGNCLHEGSVTSFTVKSE